MVLSKINIREKEFHNKLHSSGSPRSENKYYKALHNLYDDFLILLQNKTPGKKVLDFGCAAGHFYYSLKKINTLQETRIASLILPLGHG